ncbi:hypothetical protein D1AOALGA4SA_1077 [Olavius algarvensis Delta 1 endosymbiont]|nr:hypothetical protein D1AOALGA4SA_1077 [Olavius algarvensis Delta 1 endosymbiont]
MANPLTPVLATPTRMAVRTARMFVSIEWTHKRKNSHYISMIR